MIGNDDKGGEMLKFKSVSAPWTVAGVPHIHEQGRVQLHYTYHISIYITFSFITGSTAIVKSYHLCVLSAKMKYNEH